MTPIDTLCESAKIRLIANALGLQQCTKTAACIIPIPGTERLIAIGTKADVARLLELDAVAATTQASAAQAEAKDFHFSQSAPVSAPTSATAREAELLVALQQVTDAATAVVTRWHSGDWKGLPPIGDYINRLRDVVNTRPAANAGGLSEDAIESLMHKHSLIGVAGDNPNWEAKLIAFAQDAIEAHRAPATSAAGRYAMDAARYRYLRHKREPIPMSWVLDIPDGDALDEALDALLADNRATAKGAAGREGGEA